jgi:glycosyltransferase involved in cell wall biosynthesis
MSQTQAVGSTVPTISIVTATYNAADLLPRLVASLKAQTDQDFEWVVADGGSSDDTVKIVEDAKVSLRQVVLTSQPDFGIYDALNRAIKVSRGKYYLVLGADDWLDERCVENFKQVIEGNEADIYTAGIVYENGGQINKPKNKMWLYGMGGLVTGHSVGSIYRKELHEVCGYYSKKYPIAADCLFVLKANKVGVRIKACDFVSGFFGQKGVSSTDVVGSACELYRVQIELGASKLIQTMLLFLRVIKNLKY